MPILIAFVVFFLAEILLCVSRIANHDTKPTAWHVHIPIAFLAIVVATLAGITGK